MFMQVDLPEPLGPMTATNSPSLDAQIDAPQRVHGCLAGAVDLGDAASSTSGGRVEAALTLRAPRIVDDTRRRG